MKIVVTTKKLLRGPDFGTLPQNKPIDLPDVIALQYIKMGYAVRYETKEIIDSPYEAVGSLSSASPAAQVSPPQTLKKSKRGRKKKTESSSPTRPSE